MLSTVKPELRKPLDRLGTALFYVVLLASLAALTSHPTLRGETAIVTAMDSASSVEIDDGDITFRISSRSPRYRINKPDAAVIDAVNASESSGNSLQLHVHLNGARFAEFSDLPEYWIESVEYLGKKFGPYQERIRWSWRDMSTAQAALLRGVGLAQAWRFEDAVKALDVALAGDELSDGKLALGYRTRASALESLAYPPGRALNDRDDQLLMRAISDYRRAAQLDPGDYRPIQWQGIPTGTLGAYPEALALYEEVGRRWPDQYFRVAIAKGAIYRQMGDADAALRELDTLVKEHGPQHGMMYHYHRGWTLNRLAHYADAEKVLTAGLESQPDYLWAFAERACARAQQGDIAHAVDDQRQALALWDQMAELDTTARNDSDRRARLSGILDELEEALRSAPDKANPAACSDLFEGPGHSRRERSRQFKPA
jgi:tetratricopeptide (TPR) repeat protein